MTDKRIKVQLARAEYGELFTGLAFFLAIVGGGWVLFIGTQPNAFGVVFMLPACVLMYFGDKIRNESPND